MTVTTSQQDREIINFGLWFANLKRVRTTRQINERLRRFGVQTVSDAQDPEAYRRDHETLRRWLTGVGLDVPKSTRDAIWREVRAKLPEKLAARVVADETRPRFHVELLVTGLEAICALTVAILLDERRGLLTRFGRCIPAPECGRVRITWTGKPRRYCPGTDHAKRAELERVYKAVTAKRKGIAPAAVTRGK